MNDAVTPMEGKPTTSITRILGGLLGLAVLVGVLTSVSMSEARKSAQKTLQQIFDEDAVLKDLNVDSVYLPIQAGLPMSGTLVDMGLIARKMVGTFMISRKDNAKMKGGCAFMETDFNQSERNGKLYYSVEGVQVMSLKACASGLSNLLDN